MSIQPVDMNLIINKANEVNKVTTEHQRHNSEQALFSEQFSKLIERESHQTISSGKTEEEQIKDGQAGNKQGYRRAKKDNSKNKEEKTKKKVNNSSSRFDVSI